MVKKRPCAFCRKWFQPDVRVGQRQVACGSDECMRRRRARAQAAWLARQPDYFVARRIQERARRTEEGRPCTPLRVPAPLDRLPWDLAQDEFGVQGADFMGILGRVLVRHAQDEIASQVRVATREFGGDYPGAAKDERRAGA